ncbi:hypothetical protein P8452_75369 [Trifolium repens]|nr:hypothetical protein P8452_75369 [Trifolium repens]
MQPKQDESDRYCRSQINLLEMRLLWWRLNWPGEIVASDVRVNDDSEDDSKDITSWAIHDVESRQRSDRSRNHLEILINKALFPVLWFRVLIAVSLLLLAMFLLLRPANVV